MEWLLGLGTMCAAAFTAVYVYMLRQSKKRKPPERDINP